MINKRNVVALFTDKEIWATVPGYIGLEASTLGNLRHSDTGKHYTLTPNGQGQLLTRVHLTGSTGTSVLRYASQLVMLAFIGETPEGTRVKRRNKVKTDNRLINLYFQPFGK